MVAILLILASDSLNSLFCACDCNNVTIANMKHIDYDECLHACVGVHTCMYACVCISIPY